MQRSDYAVLSHLNQLNVVQYDAMDINWTFGDYKLIFFIIIFRREKIIFISQIVEVIITVELFS